MVPVRKPGRPLSSCPHPTSQSCSCAAVTAAIPRKQKCGCGTSTVSTPTMTTTELKIEPDTPGAENTPPSPAKSSTTSSNYRVQKTANRAAARKQSIGAASLERMDANQLNFISSYDGVQHKPTPLTNGHIAPSIADLTPFGHVGMGPDGTFQPQPMAFPMFQPPMSPAMITPHISKSMTNGQAAPTTNGSGEQNGTAVGGCCGGKAAAPDTPILDKNSATSAVTNGTSNNHKIRSCCAPAPESPEIKPQPDLMPPPGLLPPASGVMMTPFQTPMAMPNGIYGYFPQPTIFTYPPQYGSYLQPLQPEQWRHVMAASMGFAQPAPQPFVPGPMAYTPATTPQTAPNMDAGTSHSCSCGDTCQCVGCAAHPYNDATQEYVRSAWNTMAEDAQKAGYTNGANGHGATANETSTPNGATTPVLNSMEGTMSPTAPQTPSDAASGTTEEQTLSASDFFFVSYPFGEACEGETASCPCGDDCQCIGCAIHNNSIEVEAVG